MAIVAVPGVAVKRGPSDSVRKRVLASEHECVQTPRDTWNARYQGAQGMLFGEAPNGWLAMQRSRLTPGRRVLCPADGDGRNGVWLAALGAHVTAFDLADVGVDRARAFALQQGFTERAASACAASAAIGQRAVLDAPLGGSLTICCADISDWPWRAASVDMIAGIFPICRSGASRIDFPGFPGIARARRSARRRGLWDAPAPVQDRRAGCG